MRTTPDHITKLQPDEVFVFGSNLAGGHGAGAAKTALQWGAKMGEAFGHHGQTFALPTLDSTLSKLPLEKIERSAYFLAGYAKSHPKLNFLVTEVGCGLAGFTVEEIAPLFRVCMTVENVYLPARFWKTLLENKIDQHTIMAARDIKTSTVISVEKSGDMYASNPANTDAVTGTPVVDGQAYLVKFQDGTEGMMAGMGSSAPVLLNREYHYYITMTKAGNKKINLSPIPAGVAGKDVAQAIPGVTTADKVAPPAEKPVVPVQQPNPNTDPAEQVKVSPQLQTPTRPMAPMTEKAPVLNDTTPRKGTVKIVRFVEAWHPKDDPTGTKYKYVVTFDDGAHGIMWSEEENKAPVSLGQEILYTFGKVYQDGTKRIDVAPSGSSVDTQTVNVRLACLNAAIAVSATVAGSDTASIIGVATAFERHLLRPVE